MDLKAELLAQADAYCEAAGISRARLATLVANDGKFFVRIHSGGGLTVKMYERFMDYFREHPATQRGRVTKAARGAQETSA